MVHLVFCFFSGPRGTAHLAFFFRSKRNCSFGFLFQVREELLIWLSFSGQRGTAHLAFFFRSGRNCSFGVLFFFSRTARKVTKGHSDKLIPDDVVHQSILELFDGFHQFYSTNQNVCLMAAYRALSERDPAHIAKHNLLAMERCLGFKVEKRPSSLAQGGVGVYVTGGRVPPGAVVSFYPGLCALWDVELVVGMDTHPPSYYMYKVIRPP
jgi:hypothetical protein